MSKSPFDNQPVNNPYAQPQSIPQPNYQQGHGTPPVSPLAITSLVTGIISLPFSFCCGCLGIPLGLIAVVCGVIGISQCNSGQYSGRGMAIAGTICGGVGLLLIIGLIVMRVVLGTVVGPQFDMPNFNNAQ